MKLDKNLLMLLGAILCAFLFTFSFNKERPTDPLQYTEFLRMVRENKITEVTMNQGIVGMMDVVDVNKNKLTVNAPFDKDLLNDLIRFGVNTKIREAEQPSFWFNLFISWFPMLLLIGVWIYFMRKSTGGGGGGIFGMTKSRAQLTTSNVRFDDVAGCDEAKEDVKEFVDFLKDPTRYSQLGGKLPKGALLVGPPGTGKTLLAKAIAGEAGVPFFSLSGSDFVEMFVGVGAARTKDLFEQAKKNSPCIIFIDEIDAVGKQRGNSSYGGNDEREQTLNQLLVQMDGFSETSGIIVLAATNRVDILDEALRRPGRFDREIHVTNPDVRGREQILMVHAKKLPLGPDVNLVQLAQGTPGFSGADLANLVNEAALYAGRDNKKFVCMADFEHAKDKVMMGSERKSMIMPEHERRNTAYHEAGHTVVGVMIGNDPVHKVSIIPRGRALGVTMHSPDEDRYCLDKEHLKAELAVLMGGRAAEEVFMGQVTTGASNDMERASKIARNMVTVWGMSDKLGPLNYVTENVYSGSHFSSDTLKLIDSEVRDLVNSAYDRARSLLIEHKEETTALAEELLIKETLNDEEIVAFLPNAPEKSLRNINKRKI